MTGEMLGSLGVGAGYLIILIFLIQILLFVLLISVNMKCNRLKRSYGSFMRGKDGKSLEKSFRAKFHELDDIIKRTEASEQRIREISKTLRQSYCKKAIVRYDALNEGNGDLSFVLTMLNRQNSGWIFNSMHSKTGCYTFIKEIVKGESYIELTAEEKECLERAIFQEAYDIKDVDLQHR